MLSHIEIRVFKDKIRLSFNFLCLSRMRAQSFSFDAGRRLYDFSREKFNSYWKDILRLGHKYPEVSQGFKKGCKDLNAYVKPAVEASKTGLSNWQNLSNIKANKGTPCFSYRQI